ncbi:hypothetical protein AQS8620_02731 [Aquimixticola soesokkakensis]|uniref:Uncharacterized protein n=1 Tax=Aquimixticola soesokkakensis TaxID=1519096 RepID=A0A1Y5TCL5_9RHOB|nr:hypothetical protein [Aquimixticola soesokkakensis]SLN60532.1 hypothetical protein AQS8620_02731 [Aquimixticola soesokkakensis]
MEQDDKRKSPNRPQSSSRDARMKAALRANLAKRKAQTRARREGDGVDGDPAQISQPDSSEKDNE